MKLFLTTLLLNTFLVPCLALVPQNGRAALTSLQERKAHRTASAPATTTNPIAARDTPMITCSGTEASVAWTTLEIGDFTQTIYSPCPSPTSSSVTMSAAPAPTYTYFGLQISGTGTSADGQCAMLDDFMGVYGWGNYDGVQPGLPMPPLNQSLEVGECDPDWNAYFSLDADTGLLYASGYVADYNPQDFAFEAGYPYPFRFNFVHEVLKFGTYGSPCEWEYAGGPLLCDIMGDNTYFLKDGHLSYGSCYPWYCNTVEYGVPATLTAINTWTSTNPPQYMAAQCTQHDFIIQATGLPYDAYLIITPDLLVGLTTSKSSATVWDNYDLCAIARGVQPVQKLSIQDDCGSAGLCPVTVVGADEIHFPQWGIPWWFSEVSTTEFGTDMMFGWDDVLQSLVAGSSQLQGDSRYTPLTLVPLSVNPPLWPGNAGYADKI